MTLDLELTPSVIACAKKFLGTRDRFARWWPWLRWTVICMGILSLGCSVFAACQLHRIAQCDYGIIGDAEDPLTVEHFKIYIDSLMMRVRAEGVVFVCTLSFAAVGFHVVIAAVAVWGRHKRDALFLKVARAVLATASTALETTQQATAANGEDAAAQ